MLFALDKADCKIGKMVYIDNFLVEDEKVEIVDTYWGDKNEVKIRHSNGKEEWLPLSDLQGEVGAIIEYISKELIEEGVEQIVKNNLKEYSSSSISENKIDYKGLEVCNKTNYEYLNIAIASKSERGIITKGWFGLEKGECINVINGKLAYRSYWIHAETKEDDSFTKDADVVTDAVIHALEKKSQARYYITFATQLLATLKRLLSTRMLDKILMKID